MDVFAAWRCLTASYRSSGDVRGCGVPVGRLPLLVACPQALILSNNGKRLKEVVALPHLLS